MGKKEMDRSKRRFPTAATSAVGGLGVAVGAIPFVSSMMPNERTIMLEDSCGS